MLEEIGLPLTLLGALWGAMSVVLKAYNELIKRRDEIFDIINKKQKSYNQPPSNQMNHTCDNANTPDYGSGKQLNIKILQRYFSDLFPMSFGLFLFLALMSVILFWLPSFLVDGTGARSLCWITATFPTVLCLGFFWGGIIDFINLKKYFNDNVY
jgi:hypothetical protein